MPTIDELLNADALQDDEESFSPIDGYSVVPYEDPQIVIISKNKEITDIENQISIEGEANSQYIVFERERYEDGIDLSTKILQIHYEREDGIGDNSSPVNVECTSDKLRFGWIVPPKATEINGTLKIMPFAYGTSPTGDSYILKVLYYEYEIHDGLAIGGGIEEPNDEWYTQFLYTMQNLLEQSIQAKNSAKESMLKASESETNALNSQEEAAKSAASASVSDKNAQTARDSATESASQAKKYYENTKELSITNVGDVTISIDAEKKCLVAQYMESEDETLPDDWYTEFLKQVGVWLEQAKGSALSAGNSESKAKEYMENAENASNEAVSANKLAQQAKTECLNSSGSAQESSNLAKSYYEQTKALSVSSVGDIVFGLNTTKKCLTATYE